MKTQHLSPEDLSNYLDGEANEPQAVARHLQQCQSCARRYMELSKISAHLKALPPPEVHPAFLTRVMAQVGETRQAHSAWWLPIGASRLGVRLAVAALAVLTFVGAAWWVLRAEVSRPAPRMANQPAAWQPANTDRPDPAAPSTAVPDSATPEDPQDPANVLLAFLEAPADSEDGTELGGLLMASAEDVVSADFPSADEWVDALATADWLDQLGDVLDSQTEFDTVLESLDDSEAAMFKQLLVEYAQGGVSS